MRKVATHDDDTLRARHVDAMGRELGSTYHSLASDLSWLYVRWNIHRQLFGHSRERHETLSRTAPRLFYVLQRLLWEDILLGIARMTDSPKSAGRSNLSVRALPAMIDEDSLRAELEAAVLRAVNDSDFARHWRHRLIAHRDLEIALGAEAEPLPTADVRAAETALRALCDVLNLLSVSYAQPPIAYELVDFGDGGVDDLIDYLNKGLDGIDGQEP